MVESARLESELTPKGSRRFESCILRQISRVLETKDLRFFGSLGFTEEQFAVVFPAGTDIAFIDEIEANGIHGTLFYELDSKKAYYPTRKDEEAVNPDRSRLR